MFVYIFPSGSNIDWNTLIFSHHLQKYTFLIFPFVIFFFFFFYTSQCCCQGQPHILHDLLPPRRAPWESNNSHVPANIPKMRSIIRRVFQISRRARLFLCGHAGFNGAKSQWTSFYSRLGVCKGCEHARTLFRSYRCTEMRQNLIFTPFFHWWKYKWRLKGKKRWDKSDQLI